MSNADDAYKEFLLAELDRTETAMWRSEEIGEKRFSFFVSLLAASATALVALWTRDHSNATGIDDTKVTAAACFVLLVFGLLTFLRMKQRDRLTAEYKGEGKMLREAYKLAFGVNCPALQALRLPFSDKVCADAAKTRGNKLLRGGYSVTMAVFNGILVVPVLYYGRCYLLAETILPALVVASLLLAWAAAK